MKKHAPNIIFLITVVLALMFIVLFGSGCSDSSSGKGDVASVQNISADDAKKLIDNGVPVIDVRTREEFEQGHIPGAKLIPLDSGFEANISDLDKEKEIVVVCATGSRSAAAADIMVNQGFKRVYNLESGMVGWTYDVE